jgi:hypothetical protein
MSFGGGLIPGWHSFLAYPYMLRCMLTDHDFLEVFSGQTLLGSLGQRCSLVGCPTKASVASRSGTAHQGAGRQLQRRVLYPCLTAAFYLKNLFPCAGKEMRPMPLRKGRSAACASSCNPRTALVSPKPSQSRARPVLQTRTVARAAASTVSSYT